MATETQDGVELRNSVDNTSAEAGFQRLEKAAADTARRINENQAKETAKAERLEEAAERSRETRLRKRVTMAIALGTAAADIGGQALRSAGHEEAGQALSGAAEEARKLGTMLSPLGHKAAALGAAVGAAVGAVKGYVNAHAEAVKRMNALTQSIKDAAVDRAIEERRLDTPEKKAEHQHEARERMEDLRIKLDKGATISEKDVTDAARWDAGLARDLIALFKEQNGGAASEALQPYEDLYAAGRKGLKRNARWYDEQVEAAEAAGRRPSRDFLRQRDQAHRQLEQVEALGPEVLRTAKRGTGYDEEADRLYAELHAPKEEKTKESLSESRPDERPGSLLSAKADSLSASGIGYTGNPMQQTETLLREIRDDARRNARRTDVGVMA